MGEVVLEIAGRSQRLACRDGDEARIATLGADIAARAKRLTAALGPMPEARLLLMTALTIADELGEARNTARSVDGSAAAGPVDPVDTVRLAALVARVEALADALES